MLAREGAKVVATDINMEVRKIIAMFKIKYLHCW